MVPPYGPLCPPFGGRRRGWAIITQILAMFVIASFVLFDPSTQSMSIAYVGFMLAVLSASQDIVLDAYRRELLEDSELGIGNSFFVNAYRLSSLVPGSALILADMTSWTNVFL